MIGIICFISVFDIIDCFNNSFIKFVSGTFNKREESINKSFNFYITKKYLVF